MPLQESLKTALKNPNRLPEWEWRFESVPESELEACWNWEIGRELVLACSELFRCHGVQTPLPPEKRILEFPWLPSALLEASEVHAPVLLGLYMSVPAWQRLPPEAKAQFAVRPTSTEAAFEDIKRTQLDGCLFRVLGEDEPSLQVTDPTTYSDWIKQNFNSPEAYANGDSVDFEAFRKAAQNAWLSTGEKPYRVSYGGFSICWDWTCEEIIESFGAWLRKEHKKRRSDWRKNARKGPKFFKARLAELGALRCSEHYGRKYLNAVEQWGGIKGVPALREITPCESLNDIDKAVSPARSLIRELSAKAELTPETS